MTKTLHIDFVSDVVCPWCVVGLGGLEAAVERLKAEGIEARVYPEFQGGYYGESVNIPVKVLVPEHRALEARAVMERLEQP